MARRNAAWMRQQAAAERSRAEQAISRAEFWERSADELERLERLQHRPYSGTRIRDMEQGTAPKTVRRRGPALKSTGPVATAARAAGVAMHEIARRMGVDYELVKKWDQRGHVPDKYRQALFDAAKA